MASGETIQSIDYDAEKQELRVTFADGRMVLHPGVPGAIRAGFAGPPDLMQFYITHIREPFPRA